MMELSVVIPVYNEVENVKPLYNELKEVLDELNKSYEIIFVDDGSSDGTYDKLLEIHSQDKSVKIIRLRKNFGQTLAIKAGFDYATGKVIITLDGDMQNDPRDIPDLLQYITDYDVVCGWRKHRKDSFFLRTIPSKIANFIICKITGLKLHDFGSTFRAYKKEILNELVLYGELHRFLPAILAQNGAKIKEIPIHHRKRPSGKPKYGLSRIFRVIPQIIALQFFYSGFVSPVTTIGLGGLLSILLGIISGIGTIWLKFAKGIDMTGNPLLYLTILLMLIGTTFIVPVSYTHLTLPTKA